MTIYRPRRRMRWKITTIVPTRALFTCTGFKPGTGVTRSQLFWDIFTKFSKNLQALSCSCDYLERVVQFSKWAQAILTILTLFTSNCRLDLVSSGMNPNFSQCNSKVLAIPQTRETNKQRRILLDRIC